MRNKKKMTRLFFGTMLVALSVWGCGRKTEEKNKESILSENIIITETGEVLEKEEELGKEREDEPGQEMEKVKEPESSAEPQAVEENAAPMTVSLEQLVEPEQEQIVTEEDQKEPQGYELQLVFLGDSIFDTNRDGTGIPYLTAVECGADVYNLSNGGTCAAIAREESTYYEEWTSTSLVGVVNAIMKKIPTSVFEGRATKEILDNPNIDFTQTDYFIIEYGMNDFLSASPLDSESGEVYNLKTYAGALRYSVTNLRGVAPDATIILCGPNYAQFYNGNWMIGDGNSVNNGYGTLADYVGVCNYVANEYQTLFFNAYQDLGIDGYSADKYLEDGVHLTAEGRQVYADALAEMILNFEETKNN